MRAIHSGLDTPLVRQSQGLPNAASCLKLGIGPFRWSGAISETAICSGRIARGNWDSEPVCAGVLYSRPVGRFSGRSSGRFPQEQRPDGKKVLERISKETGGAFFEVSKKLPLDAIYKRIEEELRSQYSLGYTPARTSNGSGYRKIHVSAKQKGLVVQARDGYYAGG